jgi:tripartite-type tricarboxylate transporter receptor subunit TctC
MHHDIVSALSMPDVRERLTALGFSPDGSGPEPFGARIRSEMKKWDQVIREAKIKIE